MRATHVRSPPNKGKRYPAEVLRPEEVRLLIAECDQTSPVGLRNRALLVVLYRAGLRHSEALDLYPKDIDLEAGSIVVLNGKGGKRRTVGIDRGAVDVIESWVRRRAGLGFGPHQRLFCSIRGRRLSSSYMRTVLPRLGREAGIAKRVHPHGLRHTFAYEAMMEGISLKLIQLQLGHSSLATTDAYLSHLAPADVLKAIHARQWTL